MYRIKITRDEAPFNPRTENDNADMMFCEHRRYVLGDKDAKNPVEEVFVTTLDDGDSNVYELQNEHDGDGYGRNITNNRPSYEEVLGMLEEHRDGAEEDGTTEEYFRADEGFQYVSELQAELETCLRPGIALCRPLYLYDHGGITISAGSFSCQRDSGQVGWQYMTVEAFEEFGDRERALACMDATLKEYDDYLTGNVWGFVVEKGVRVAKLYEDGRAVETIEWEPEDPCWGFFGDWHKEGDPTGMRDHLPAEVCPVFDKMVWSDTDVWHYTDDTPDEAKEG